MNLTLYTRSYCHLCEDMHKALLPYQQRYGFKLELIDVDSDAQLERRFDELVPVLMAGEEEICHYFLDEAALLNYFSQQ
ncbi:MAG TPA: glutaredoxin family protein [Gammaproteobacteria bacterium]|nr:glutaredoxin family protein [Gammaproteobacteria bacterium]